MANQREIDRFKAELEEGLRLEDARDKTLDSLLASGMTFEAAARNVMSGDQGAFVRQLAKAGVEGAELDDQADLYSQMMAEIGNSKRGSWKVRKLRAEYRQRGLKI